MRFHTRQQLGGRAGSRPDYFVEGGAPYKKKKSRARVGLRGDEKSLKPLTAPGKEGELPREKSVSALSGGGGGPHRRACSILAMVEGGWGGAGSEGGGV